MARKPRGILPGGIYHVYARGNDRRPLFLDDADRRTYLVIMAEECAKRGWIQLAYCLMGNHFHVLFETTIPNLSEGMHRLQTRYVRHFNFRHKRTGHVFEERFGAVPVTSDKQLIAVTRYIAMNPVEAGLCKRPEEWTWTNCAIAETRCAAL